MRKHFKQICLEISLRAALCGPCPFSLVPRAAALRRRPGQTTVEYLLMLAVVAGMAAMMAVLFHKRILGGIFTMVGLIIGAGQPK
ncbi:MAG: hypothetical protein A2X35_11890 [Elusimicrobia bacterium GWA2_61_42]|nr:MAG: hypothetical protein A2X35_11890 [Elusimicrobia bacterium GWA2_61_42]OGR76348.1 MAG: hypothetical protein A2X38_01060 [Elusimicrobia bacterium GWC2_61_25]